MEMGAARKDSRKDSRKVVQKVNMRWRKEAAAHVSDSALELPEQLPGGESTTTTSPSTISSPLGRDQEDYDEPDSAAALNPNETTSSSQLPTDSILLGSAADPDADPPYSQQQPWNANTDLHASADQSLQSSPEPPDQSQTFSQTPTGALSDDDEHDEAPAVVWKPQATQSTCEFTHTITQYSHKRDSGCKKAEYSATTVDEFGNRWRLIVYVNGNGRASNHHLSLFLQVADADDLPFGWKKAVSYVLTLEHPTGPNLSYAKRNPDKTFKLCPKAIDWGWSQFITSDRIQQEGFVQDDSLVVRASVTVKTSSVSIDLEDAELYLKCAVEEGKPDAVQLCLDQGASVNCQFKDDLYTPLHTACSSSTTEDDNSTHSRNSNDTESNHNGSMQVLQLLLEKGADGNACNKWRETPLLIAANNGHRSAVEALLKHGADPSLCSEAGWSALTFAAHKGYDDIVQLLLRAGAPVNCRVTEDASTPLHKACAGSKPGHLLAVKLLLDNGADVHALNKWRETPLLTAANHGQAGAVDSLLKAGADPCKCTDTGWSPLSIAAYKGHDDVVRLLLEEGAPTEEADPTLSALLQAATKGLPDTVELLLKHGADHTVTTKKGDTALSILVEQNLIDAAVEMVTEYKASIPRCSRDRKKVQRARLLINLRVKQREDQGVGLDETDDEDSGLPVALHANGKPQVKKKKKKMSAEEQATAAADALLLELEQEDAERQKQEQEASKKSAKKRKKKERERQQKKEQEERRIAQEKERDEKRRKDREEKEAKERAERERLAAIKRKEEEEERKRLLEERQKQLLREEQRKKEKKKAAPEKTKAKPKRPTPAVSASAVSAPAPAVPAQPARPVAAAPKAKSAAPKPATAPAAPPARAAGKNRGWETKVVNEPEPKQTPQKPSPPPAATTAPEYMTPQREAKQPVQQQQQAEPLNPSSRSNSSSPFLGGELLTPSAPGPVSYTKSEPILNGFNSSMGFSGTELPAVALFRHDKVSELLQRCSVARTTSDPLGVVSEATMKKVLYRWMVRAAHDSLNYLDCIIPSWLDFDELTTFFQRQFISESRKGVNLSAPMVGMEALREAGSAFAQLCHSLAKEVADFRRRVEEQISPDWADRNVGMSASDVMRNGGMSSAMVVVDWANRSQVYLPALTFRKLSERYVGVSSRLLSSVFSTKIRYDTKQLITADTPMDSMLPPETQSVLSMEAHVTAEVWTDPLSALAGNVFWGMFADVDALFGGLQPFGKADGGEDLLARHGGSVSVVTPMDNMVATRYMHRMVDILDVAEKNGVPVCFAVFLRADCFVEWSHSPNVNDLFTLEPRLRERNEYLGKVEQLAAGQHSFHSPKTGGLVPSPTGTLFVLLCNEAGRARFDIRDGVVAEILRSLGGTMSVSTNEPALMPPMSFSATEFVPSKEPSLVAPPVGAGYFNSQAGPGSPIAQQAPSDFSDFGAIGGTTIGNTFSAAPATGPRGRPARGRLFDLVDDGEEDNSADVVSGMLGNLNMDLFQHTGSNDIDIEAISLMGIGGPPANGGLQPRQGRFG